jgi:kynurenine formamidase
MLVDLSHRIYEGMRPYPGLASPRIDVTVSREESASRLAPGVSFEISTVCMVANTGTYIDAPFHYFADGPDIAQLRLEQCANLPVVVIDARDERAIGESAFDDALDFAGAAVLFRTDWSRHWGTSGYEVDSPFLTSALVQRLIDSGPVLVGIDALNVDRVDDAARPAHHGLLGAGIPIVEHLTNLAAIPQQGARLTVVPAPISGMGTMPVRAFAVTESTEGAQP